MENPELPLDLKSQKKLQKQQLQQNQHDLTNEYHELKTPRQVQSLTEKVVNGVLQGVIKRDKGGLLIGLLPLAWKQAQALDGKHLPSNVQILNINQKNLTLQMTDKELDEYLAGNDSVKIEILNKIAPTSEEPRAIEMQANEVDESKIKLDHKTLGKILKNTGIPPKQTLNLFGKVLRDTKDKGAVKYPQLQSNDDFPQFFDKDKTPVPLQAKEIEWQQSAETLDNSETTLEP